MFERFTDRARRVVVLAQEEARLLNHHYIGTEHLLLGLVHEGEGIAALALTASGLTLEECRRRVEEIIGRGQDPASGHVPYTPRGKRVLELALREALQLGHNYIGTEHLLLGLIREGEGVAAQVLVKLDVELNELRREVLDLLSKQIEENETKRAQAAFDRTGDSQLLVLLQKLGQRVVDMGVADFECVTTQREGECTEVLTIRWP